MAVFHHPTVQRRKVLEKISLRPKRCIQIFSLQLLHVMPMLASRCRWVVETLVGLVPPGTPAGAEKDETFVGWPSKGVEQKSNVAQWEPTTFIFRGYNYPYIWGLKPSFFMVFGSNSWWFQPIWTKYAQVKLGENLPQVSGWTFQKYLSCHHL